MTKRVLGDKRGLECRVLLAVLEHLLEVVVVVNDLIVNDLTALLDRNDLRIDESSVRLEAKGCITVEYFSVEYRIYVYSILLYKLLTSLKVSLRLDALNFCEEFAEKSAESFIVVNHEICLSVTYLLLDHVIGKSLLVAPVSDKLAVLHMSLGVLLAEFDSVELSEDTVTDIA